MKKLLTILGTIAILAVPVLGVTTNDLTSSAYGPAAYSERTYVLAKDVDFSVYPMATSDMTIPFNIESNTYVHLVSIRMLTASTTTNTFYVGDSSSATAYGTTSATTNTGGVNIGLFDVFTAASVSASTTTSFPVSVTTTTTGSIGKRYAARDYIRLTSASAATISTGKIRVRAIITSLE